MDISPLPTPVVDRSAIRMASDGTWEVGGVVFVPEPMAADVANELLKWFSAGRRSRPWRTLDDAFRWSRAPASTGVGDLVASPRLQLMERIDDGALFAIRRLLNLGGRASAVCEIEMKLSSVDPDGAPELAQELLEWMAVVVGGRSGVSGFVGLGAVYDPFEHFFGSNWRVSFYADHVGSVVPGYYWAMLLSDRELAAVDGAVLEGRSELLAGPSGALLLACPSPATLTAEDMMAMRKAVWPLLGLRFVAHGPTRQVLVFEGGPAVDAAQRLASLEQKGELRALGATALREGAGFESVVRFDGVPDDLSVAEIGWVLDAWRRAAAYYRAAPGPTELEWEKWMPYHLDVDGPAVRVTVDGLEPGPWRDLLGRLLKVKARESSVLRIGETEVSAVEVP